MRKGIKACAFVLVLVVVLSLLAACADPFRQTLTIEDITIYALEEGEPLTVTFGDPEKAETITYEYDPSKLSIENGKVLGYVEGSYTVKATAVTCETTFIVTVLPAKEYIVVDNLVAIVGDPAYELTVFLDESVKDDVITYEFDSDAISIENNYVTAISEGEVKVTARVGDHETEFYVSAKTIDRTVGKGYFYMRENEGWTAAATNWRYEWDKFCSDGKTTLFIGDSFFDMRYFWTDFYSYYGLYDARCFGIGGTTSQTWELLLLNSLLKGVHPKNIVVNVGNNNVYNDHTETDETIENLQRFFNLLHGKMPDTRIYFYSITDRAYDDIYGSHTIVKQTNAAMKRWASAHDWITYIDLEDVMTFDQLKTDNIHPKLDAYAYFVDALNDAGIELEVK